MNRVFFLLGGFFLLLALVWLLLLISQKPVRFISPLVSEIKERPLDKYTIPSLGKTEFKGNKISLGKIINETSYFTAYLFSYTSGGKKVSGMVHIPKDEGKHPVIVMFRGYVDQEEYTTGMGTVHAAEVFSKNGFITLAPDFLGYGESSSASASPMVERFETHTVALDLLASVATLPQADASKVGIWGHSNGGQIALSVLEITQKSYPTVLWAPVSKPFPYSVLYYTDTFEDRGKMLRKVIADFEKDYDIDLYSITSYFDNITAPLQIHQGGLDDQVPQKWSDDLVKNLIDIEKDVTYFTYPEADHNLSGSWDTVVSRDVEFLKEHLLNVPE